MFLRPQTFFLFLGLVSMVLLAFIPSFEVRWLGETAQASYLFHWTLKKVNFWYYLWQISGGLTMLGFFISPFLYKNRIFQMRFNAFVFLFLSLFIVGMFFLPDQLAQLADGVANIKTTGFLLPLVSLISLVIANKAIKEDEIKSRIPHK